MEKTAQQSGRTRSRENFQNRRLRLPTPQKAPVSSNSLPVKEMLNWFESWIDDQQIALHSQETINLKRFLFNQLAEFLGDNGFQNCGPTEIRKFFATLKNKASGQPLAISTNETYRRAFRAFFNYLIRRGALTESPMVGLPEIPASKRELPQVQPFGAEQQQAILAAARQSPQPRRDVALVYLCFDTGLRASEICRVQFRDMDMTGRSVRTLGKGDKKRTVYFTAYTSRALWNYFRQRGVNPMDEPDGYLFVAVSGKTAGEAMTRSGIYQAFSKLCIAAGITDGKLGTHRARHSFASGLAENDAYSDTIQSLLGHSDPKMTQRYVKIKPAKMQQQHGRCSPVMNWGKKQKDA